MGIISFQANYIFKITDDLTVTIRVYEPDWDNIPQNYYGEGWQSYMEKMNTYPGEDWINAIVRIEDSVAEEEREIRVFFPIYSKEIWTQGLVTLFNNCLFMTLKSVMGNYHRHPVEFFGTERYTSDHPDVAWMYHKTIYDRVMEGKWAFERISFNAQMEIAREDGEIFKIIWDENERIRLYSGDKRLGRVTIIKKEKDDRLGIIQEYPFLLPLEEELEPDVEYQSVFDKAHIEEGAAIVNVKNFSELVQGIEMAVAYFLGNP